MSQVVEKREESEEEEKNRQLQSVMRFSLSSIFDLEKTQLVKVLRKSVP